MENATAREMLDLQVTIVSGDLLDQDVDAVVNTWNRNLFPWWMLLPQGVSGAIKKQGGFKPFNELRRFGILPLGAAVTTGPGRLNCKGIIHVAGINLMWRASEKSIRLSVQNALFVAAQNNYKRIAFPIIGAGSGGFDRNRALEIMQDELKNHDYDLDVIIVVKKGR